jgi:hypothetical protein
LPDTDASQAGELRTFPQDELRLLTSAPEQADVSGAADPMNEILAG